MRPAPRHRALRRGGRGRPGAAGRPRVSRPALLDLERRPAGRLVPGHVRGQPPELRRLRDDERLPGLTRPGRVPQRRRVARLRPVRRIADHGRLAHVLERRRDRQAGRAHPGHDHLGSLVVLREVVGRLEQAVVAGRELERLELPFGRIGRLEADALLGVALALHDHAGRVRLRQRRRERHVCCRACRVRGGDGRNGRRLLVRRARLEDHLLADGEDVAVPCADTGRTDRRRDAERRRLLREAVGTGLERVRDHAAVVPVLVGTVAGRRVEDVRDRPRPLREDDRVPELLDPVQDPVTCLEEVLLDADVRVHGRALTAVRQVRARRPHEVAAEAVDVVREPDVLERVRDPELVLDLRLGGLGRPGERFAGAVDRRTDVAVDERPERVVAVHVRAPGVPGGGVVERLGDPSWEQVRPRRPEIRRVRVVGLEPADHAPVGHRLPLAVEVVDRVVPAVRVRGREDEDVELVDQLPRRLVDPVVPEQLLRGLETGQRRRPLTGVLLAVEEDADAAAVDALVGAVARPVLADPQHEVLERPARNVGVRRRREEVGQVALRPRLDGSGARVATIRLRDELGGRARVGVDRRRHLGGRARERARRARREGDDEVVADEAHRERRVRHERVDELGREVVAALVAPRPRGEDDGLWLRRRRQVPGQGRIGHSRHQGLRPPLVPVRLVRKVDDRGQVRELRGKLAEAPVDLGRIHVARREVAEVRLVHRRQPAAEPGVHVGVDELTQAGPDPDLRRRRRRRAAELADPHQEAVLDVRVRRRVGVDVHVHRSRALVDRRPLAGVPRERQRCARRREPARTVLRLDGEEAAGVVLEVVDAEDDDVAARRDRRTAFGERGRVGGLLGLDVCLPRLCVGAPARRPLDRRSDRIPGGFEGGKLLRGAEDGHGHRAVVVVAQIVVVEVDSVRIGLELQLDRCGLVGQVHLDEAPALVRVDPPLGLLRPGAAGGREHDHRRGKQHSACSPCSHDGNSPLQRRFGSRDRITFHPRWSSCGQSGSRGIVSPSPRPSSTARVRASVPKRVRTSSTAASSAPSFRRSIGSISCSGRSSSRFATATPTSVTPRCSIVGLAAASKPRAVARIVCVCAVGRSSVCDLVAREKSSKRSRSTTVRPTRRAARSRRVTRSTSPISDASSSSCDVGPRPSARCDPIEPRRRPVRTDRGSRLCASACRWRPEATPSIDTSTDSGSTATCRTFEIPRARSFAAVTGPTPQSRSTGSGWRNLELLVGRHLQEPVRLRDGARDLGEELRPGDADRDRQPDPLEHVAPQPFRDLDRRPEGALHAAHVEEGLVDRETLDERGRVLEHLEHGLARLDVGGEARLDGDRVRAEATRLALVHRRPDPERLGLVARGEHDAHADEHRPPAQPLFVPLLDRREERVQVGVQDRRLSDTNACSHSQPCRESQFLHGVGHRLRRARRLWLPGTSTTVRLRRGGRDPERITLALDDEHRHRSPRRALGAGSARRAGPAAGAGTRGRRRRRRRSRRRSGTRPARRRSGRRRGAAAPATRRRREAAPTHGRPGRVELGRRGRRPPSGDAVRLLDERDGHARCERPVVAADEVGRRDASPAP